MIAPGLYVGDVMHRRLRPKRHAFRYRAFWLVLDLDTLAMTAAPLRWLSLASFNLFSFHERDHADGQEGGLAAKIRALAARSGLDASGPLRLLTMPRVCGYVFNPLSVYFCHGGDERLTAIVWEVSNTFGERHSYVLPVDGSAEAIRQSCRKAMHVSPFIDMDIAYRFRVARKAGAIAIGIVDEDKDGALLVAAMAAKHEPLTDAGLLRAFARIPFATLKTMAAIHWEALRLLLRGVRFRSHPGARRAISEHSAGA